MDTGKQGARAEKEMSMQAIEHPWWDGVAGRTVNS